MTPTFSLAPRFALPPSTYISGAKLSLKLILAIIFLVLITILSLACLCYICIRRRKARRHARRLAREAAESKALPPRINRRNARWFGPGIVREEQMRRDEEVEMERFIGQGEVEMEVRMPGRVRGGWREVMRAVSRR